MVLLPLSDDVTVGGEVRQILFDPNDFVPVLPTYYIYGYRQGRG